MFTSKIDFKLPTKEEIEQAHIRISDYVHRTPILKSEGINSILNSTLLFKCENFQKVGAFKSRGAVNAVFSLSNLDSKNGVCTHSSGNHAQALARAAALKGIDSYIVMPKTAPKVKVEAVKSYGGKITFCEPNLQARESTLKEIQKKTNAVEIHPYDNLNVITAQATAAKEIFEDYSDLDYLICPVGGGGLLSGTLLSRKYFSPNTKIIAAEPLGANRRNYYC
jgi:threonine dehydratase